MTASVSCVVIIVELLPYSVVRLHLQKVSFSLSKLTTFIPKISTNIANKNLILSFNPFNFLWIKDPYLVNLTLYSNIQQL